MARPKAIWALHMQDPNPSWALPYNDSKLFWVLQHAGTKDSWVLACPRGVPSTKGGAQSPCVSRRWA